MAIPSARRALIGYTAPFAAFIALMAMERALALPPGIGYPIRFATVSVMLVLLSRPYLSLRPRHAAFSIVLGAAVFLIWIAPDLLVGYRHSWLFQNPLMGHVKSTIPDDLRQHIPFLVVRVAGSMLVVPVIEELFWRGWLMRWLIQSRFIAIPFGAYAPGAFWITALLFAFEHGPYWEVGLLAGILYNWWAIRTGSLADCILAHAVTNGLLSAFVLLTGQWQYWS